MKRRVMARPLPTPRTTLAKRVIPPLAGVALLVLGLVAIYWMLPRGSGPGPSATSTRAAVGQTPSPPTPPPGGSVAVPSGDLPTNGATAPPLVTPGIPTGNAGLIVDWQEVSGPGLGVVVGMTASASSNGRVVVVGDSTLDYFPAIWTSADGASWQRADLPDNANNALTMTGVTAGGPGFVALAYDSDADAAVSYASVDGSSWQRAADPDLVEQSIYLVAAAGTNVVALADSGSVFTSTDGLSWDLASDASALVSDGDFLDVASYAGSMWAFSAGFEEDLPPIDVWRTDDGIAWVHVATIPGSGGALDARAAAGADGLVVLSEVERPDSLAWMAWHSADGITWQQAINSPTEVTDLLADDLGFVGVGHQIGAGSCAMDETENVGVTWTSVNGVVWRQMPTEGWLGREVAVLGVTGRTLVGVGVDWNLLFNEVPGESGIAFTTALPAEALDDAPPPQPTPEPTLPPDCF